MNTNYITYLQSQSRSPLTIANYIRYVDMFLKYVNKPEQEIEYMDLISWKNTFTNLKPNSQNIRISAVKNYFSFLKKIGVVEHDVTESFEKTKVRECDVEQKPYITAEQLRSMVNCATTFRDKAIVLLFATTGVRFSELANITLEDYANLSGEDDRELTIVGKGNKVRRIYIVDETKEAIDMYLATRPDSEYNNLFLSFGGKPLQNNNLSNTIKNIAKKAGLPFYEKMGCHSLRAGYATTKHAQGESLINIQEALGHASLNTTRRYIKRSQSEINASMKRVAF